MNTSSAVIPQEALKSTKNYTIHVKAEKDTVFALEARFENTLISIDDLSFRVEELDTSEKVCYSYTTKGVNESLLLKLKSYGGALALKIGSSPSTATTSLGEFIEGTQEISARQLKAFPKEIVLCIQAAEPATFSFRMFRRSLESESNEFIKLLKRLMDSDSIMDRESLRDNLSEKSALKRVLLEQAEKTQPKEEKPVEEKKTVSTEGFSFNGTGVTAIAIFIIFFIPVLIAISCMSDIFVTNKFLDKPISLGKVEY